MCTHEAPSLSFSSRITLKNLAMPRITLEIPCAHLLIFFSIHFFYHGQMHAFYDMTHGMIENIVERNQFTVTGLQREQAGRAGWWLGVTRQWQEREGVGGWGRAAVVVGGSGRAGGRRQRPAREWRK
jgi:hypothetical protein